MTPSERYNSLKPFSWYFPVVLPNKAVVTEFNASCGECKHPIPDENERGELERVQAGVRFKCVGLCANCGKMSYSSGLILASRHRPGWEVITPQEGIIVDPWTRDVVKPPPIAPLPQPEPKPEELMQEFAEAVREDEWTIGQTATVIILAALAVFFFWFGSSN